MLGDQLSLRKKLSFGVGHVLNDLSASMWFSYLLVYLHRIVRFENALSGYVMLLGQVADAISTAFVGFESDKTQHGLFNYGRRKSWHLIGVISVLISFPFMYNLCIGCSQTAEWLRFYYYAPFVVIFQFGWAATQISHLSLIPQLTHLENERIALNAIRYAFTVASNLFVYAVAYLLLKYSKDDSSDDNNLTPADAPKFTYMVLIICVVGIIFQLAFHLGTDEKNLPNDDQMQQRVIQNSTQHRLDWRGYLKWHRFYTMAVLYLCTRLIVNMTQVYMPMFLTETLTLEKSSIALIPFICYLSGFLCTFPLRFVSKKLGCYATYCLGLLLIVTCAAFMWFYDVVYSKQVTAYVIAVLLGAGSTVILVTSLSLTTNLIGNNTGVSAFVFGSMSFADKLSNGVTVALLQQFSPTVSCGCYYHYIMVFLPAACSCLAACALFLLFLGRPKPTNSNVLLINDDGTGPSLDEVDEVRATREDEPCLTSNYVQRYGTADI